MPQSAKPSMPKLEFSERFVTDLASVASKRLEQRILDNLDNIELFAEFGSPDIPVSIREEFDGDIRKIAVNPFDLIYTYYADKDLCRVEALIHQKAAR